MAAPHQWPGLPRLRGCRAGGGRVVTARAWTDSSRVCDGEGARSARRLPSAGKLVLPAQRGRAERALADATAPRRPPTPPSATARSRTTGGPAPSSPGRTPRTPSPDAGPSRNDDRTALRWP